MKKRYSVILFLIVLMMLPAMPIIAQEERVLQVWTHDYQPLADAITSKWGPEFEALNPGVKVEYTSIPFAGAVDYDTKLLADLSSGGGPDVWVMGSWDYLENGFIESGLVAPLDPTIFGYDSVDDLVADYPPNSMNAFVRDGKVYGLFNELTTLALFYNKNMFDAAGIEYLPEDKPVSWAHIGEISQQLRKTDPGTGELTQIGYQFGFFATFRSPQWYAQDYYIFLRQYGQDDLFIDGEPAANTEAAIKAFQMIYDFTYTYQAYDPTFLQNWFADFPNNRVAMVAAGPWFVAAARGTDPNLNFGVAPVPVIDPADPATYHNIVYNWGWSVNANKSSEQQQLAQEFLAYLLGKKGEAEQPVYWFENMGLAQPRSAFLQSDGYKAALASEPWMATFDRSYQMFDTQYVQHSYDLAGAALIRAIDRVIYDGMSAEETAKLLQRELQRLQ
jgi:ABC-type glycerol-3-phosphate transport system substrate-binding protein